MQSSICKHNEQSDDTFACRFIVSLFTRPLGGVRVRVRSSSRGVLVDWHSLGGVHRGIERGGLGDPGVALEGGPVAAGLSLWEMGAASPQRSETERISAVLQENSEAKALAVTHTFSRYTHAHTQSTVPLMFENTVHYCSLNKKKKCSSATWSICYLKVYIFLKCTEYSIYIRQFPQLQGLWFDPNPSLLSTWSRACSQTCSCGFPSKSNPVGGPVTLIKGLRCVNACQHGALWSSHPASLWI